MEQQQSHCFVGDNRKQNPVCQNQCCRCAIYHVRVDSMLPEIRSPGLVKKKSPLIIELYNVATRHYTTPHTSFGQGQHSSIAGEMRCAQRNEQQTAVSRKLRKERHENAWCTLPQLIPQLGDKLLEFRVCTFLHYLCTYMREMMKGRYSCTNSSSLPKLQSFQKELGPADVTVGPQQQ